MKGKTDTNTFPFKRQNRLLSVYYVFSPFYRAEEAELCFNFTQKILNRYDNKHFIPPLPTYPPIPIEVLNLQ